MCTVSWAKRPDGYTLFFNRDESRERPAGLPPALGTQGGASYICPKDPAGGGTWLLVNEFGLSMGLLNYYEAQMDYTPVQPKSRGQLPLDCAHCTNLDEVTESIQNEDLTPYPPFHFLSVNLEAAAILITWNGKTTSVSYPTLKDLPISTSSFKTEEVIEARRSLFKQTAFKQIESNQALEIFHTSKLPSPDTHAVLMTRVHAKTVSISQIEVNASEAQMTYRARHEDSDKLHPPITRSLKLS